MSRWRCMGNDPRRAIFFPKPWSLAVDRRRVDWSYKRCCHIRSASPISSSPSVRSRPPGCILRWGYYCYKRLLPPWRVYCLSAHHAEQPPSQSSDSPALLRTPRCKMNSWHRRPVTLPVPGNIKFLSCHDPDDLFIGQSECRGCIRFPGRYALFRLVISCLKLNNFVAARW